MQTARREHFQEVKMAISETELNLLGDDSGGITPTELIKARAALVQALNKFDTACHRHNYVARPPRADL